MEGKGTAGLDVDIDGVLGAGRCPAVVGLPDTVDRLALVGLPVTADRLAVVGLLDTVDRLALVGLPGADRPLTLSLCCLGHGTTLLVLGRWGEPARDDCVLTRRNRLFRIRDRRRSRSALPRVGTLIGLR